MNDRVIRVLVVDDNDLMRRGLSDTFSVEPDMLTVGSARNATEALQLYQSLKPDVVTMDYQMPGESGVECTRILMSEDPAAKVILMSIFDTEEDIGRAVAAGVKGYLTKKSGDVDVLIEAVHQVASGATYFPEAIRAKLEHRKDQKHLTPREMQVLKLLATGNSNKEICEKLKLSMPTAKFHVVNIRDKLGAVDRTDAVMKALRRGLLRLDETRSE